MVDKVFGIDFTDETNPTGDMTISVHNGTTLVDVALSDLVKAIPNLRVITTTAPTVNDDENDGYELGDMWLDTNTARVYMIWQKTAGNAGWRQLDNNVQDILASISSVQGVILYRNASAWVALSPGTAGQILQTGGAAANPSWVTNQSVQTLLDGISTTQGTILYFNGTDWVALSPGTAGQVLETGGAGANPSWETPAAGGGEIDTLRTKYIITPSVASNNLSLAIKYIGGGDPSVTDALVFRVGNTEYTLDAAMSFTKNAGVNWCNAGGAELATKEIDYFVYAIGETGASAGLKFGFSRIPYATTMGDFVNTTTSEKYIAGNWTNFNSTDSVTNIGRFNATLSASASFNWSIPATSVVVNYPIFETRWLSWTPTATTQAGTWTSITYGNLEYIIRGSELKANVTSALGTTSTNTVWFSLSLPFFVANAVSGFGRVVDGAAGIQGMMSVTATTPGAVQARQYNVASFTAGAGRGILEATMTFRV